MPFHPVTLTTEVNIRYVINNQAAENVLHYKWNNTTPPSTAELLSLGQEVYQTIGQKIQQFSNSTWRMVEVYCRNIDTPTANQATYTQSPPYTGTRLGTAMANQVGKSIEKKTGLTGRSHKGGMRLDGFVDGDIIGDLLQTGLQTLITNLMLSVVAPRVGGRFIPAVASKLLGDSRVITAASLLGNIVGSVDTRTTRP